MYPNAARSTPLPSDQTFQKKFNSSVGNPDKTVQLNLAKEMQLGYRSGVGELIWAMTTCRPDLTYSSVKLSQSNSCPHEIHYHDLKHPLKYLYHTRDNGLYFWQTHPRMELPEGPLPTIKSTRQDILLDNRPQFDAHIAHAYANSDWATCTKTQRSFGGTCIRLAGSTIAYKCKFQPTIAESSTEAEFMAAYDTGRYSSSKVSYGTSRFLRKWLLFSSKIVPVALLWGTHKNLLPVPDISTLNTSLYAIGWNVTSCSLSKLIHLSICQIV